MFGELLKILPRRRADLEATLQGVNGFTGRGEIEFTATPNGGRELEVGLRGVAGRSADIYADDKHALTVNLENGRVDHTFDTRRGDAVPELMAGARIEVRQNGDLILKGVLIAD